VQIAKGWPNKGQENLGSGQIEGGMKQGAFYEARITVQLHGPGFMLASGWPVE